MPSELVCYGSVQNIYEFLRKEPGKRISYNTIGKHVILIDRFGNSIKSSCVNLQKMNLSEVEQEKRQRKRAQRVTAQLSRKV